MLHLALTIVPWISLSPHKGPCWIYFHNLNEKRHLSLAKLSLGAAVILVSLLILLSWHCGQCNSPQKLFAWWFGKERRTFLFSPNIFFPTQRMVKNYYCDYYFMSWWNIRNKLKIIGYGSFGFLNLGADLGGKWRSQYGVGMFPGSHWAPRQVTAVLKITAFFFIRKKKSNHALHLTLSSSPFFCSSDPIVGHHGSLP